MRGMWRPPKKGNKKAWRKIAESEKFPLGSKERIALLFWDTKAVDRAATRRAQLREQSRAHSKARKLRKREIEQGIQGMDYPAQMFYPFPMIKKGSNW